MLLTLTASPVIASTDTHTAYFGVAVYGQSLVTYSHGHEPNPYYVGLGVGGFIFSGKASVMEYEFPLSGEWNEVVPETLKTYGWVTASWSKGGVNYAFRVLVYSIAIEGARGYLLEPEQDILIFGGMPPPIMLEYSGVFQAGSQRISVHGTCGFMVIPASIIGYPDVFCAAWKFSLVIDDISIGLAWAKEPMTTTITLKDGTIVTLSIPAARLFKHEVLVL